VPGLPRLAALARWLRLPRCGSDHGWRAPDLRWRCAGCDRRVSVTAGTIFDKTRTPLTVWFAAAWLLGPHRPQSLLASGVGRACPTRRRARPAGALGGRTQGRAGRAGAPGCDDERPGTQPRTTGLGRTRVASPASSTGGWNGLPPRHADESPDPAGGQPRSPNSRQATRACAPVPCGQVKLVPPLFSATTACPQQPGRPTPHRPDSSEDHRPGVEAEAVLGERAVATAR
jgi:hypothetical protein